MEHASPGDDAVTCGTRLDYLKPFMLQQFRSIKDWEE